MQFIETDKLSYVQREIKTTFGILFVNDKNNSFIRFKLNICNKYLKNVH